MVATNGFPKSGNHALVKAVQLLGVPCGVDHIPYSASVSSKNIFIKRDPRNVICSWLRFTGNPVTPGMFISAFRHFQSKSLVLELAEYEGWLLDEQTLVVSYEALVANDQELRRIAAYLNTPYIDGAFENLPGMTATWFPIQSNYSDIWTNELETVWNSEGGPELLKRWGY